MYDERECECSQAAWLITTETDAGKEYALFEAHVTEDQDSPCGMGWYFASYMKDASDKWTEYDGGIYWDYENANELEDIIGETLPFKAYTYQPTSYEAFEKICLEQSKLWEQALITDPIKSNSEHTARQKTYKVTITETLQRTVKVRANSEAEAITKTEDAWKYEVHVLGSGDFKDVEFNAMPYERERKGAR